MHLVPVCFVFLFLEEVRVQLSMFARYLSCCIVMAFLLCVPSGATMGCEMPSSQSNDDDSVASARTAKLESIRKASGAPGIIAGTFDTTGSALYVAGLRKKGAKPSIEEGDMFHIGSCTKSMTATLIGLLVDQKMLQWDSTLGELFPAQKIDPSWASVTIEQLLEHRSGAPANCDWNALDKAAKDIESKNKRSLVLQWLSQQKRPKSPKYQYSNVGYCILGHILEVKLDADWESIIKKKLFDPLEMTSAGFGPPSSGSTVENPMGHSYLLGMRTPVLHDNPPLLGPAGTVHCSIPDWIKYLRLHLDPASAASSQVPLSPETRRRLHTPSQGDYAGGWVRMAKPWAKDRTLFHNGSNTFWYVAVYMDLKTQKGILAAVNSGDPFSQKGCEDAIDYLGSLQRE